MAASTGRLFRTFCTQLFAQPTRTCIMPMPVVQMRFMSSGAYTILYHFACHLLDNYKTSKFEVRPV